MEPTFLRQLIDFLLTAIPAPFTLQAGELLAGWLNFVAKLFGADIKFLGL